MTFRKTELLIISCSTGKFYHPISPLLWLPGITTVFRKFTPEHEDEDGSSLTTSQDDEFNSTKTYTVRLIMAACVLTLSLHSNLIQISFVPACLNYIN